MLNAAKNGHIDIEIVKLCKEWYVGPPQQTLIKLWLMQLKMVIYRVSWGKTAQKN